MNPKQGGSMGDELTNAALIALIGAFGLALILRGAGSVAAFLSGTPQPQAGPASGLGVLFNPVDPASALQLLYHLQAIVIGLYHHAHPAPVVQQLTETPALAVLRIDLAAELRHGVRALVTATH